MLDGLYSPWKWTFSYYTYKQRQKKRKKMHYFVFHFLQVLLLVTPVDRKHRFAFHTEKDARVEIISVAVYSVGV